MAARMVGRPVKVAVTRQQMFAVGGYRTPTIQRLRLGADRRGHLLAISHEVVEQSSTLVEFAEQTAVATRMLYATADGRRTRHRLARLDLPTPSVLDPRLGAYVNHDLGGYHIAANADVPQVEAVCIDEDDPYVNPVGVKGLGEIGIVGTAAAIGNAVHHATGIRVRRAPIHLDEVIGPRG
jgi:CO/xanthine dehydrogenase Mo-binding subunit